MITSQRLIVIALIANIMIGLAIDNYYNPRNAVLTDLQDFISNINTQEADITDEDTYYDGQKSSNLITDNTILDALRIGVRIVTLLFSMVIPVFGAPDNYSLSLLEGYILLLLNLFRSFLFIIVAFEIYLIFKNRKSS